jgi:hypothetical protein
MELNLGTFRLWVDDDDGDDDDDNNNNNSTRSYACPQLRIVMHKIGIIKYEINAGP